MAEGFEQYHVPQQIRRDKLRVNNPPFSLDNNAAALLPLYDPSLLSSDLIHQSFNLGEMHMIAPSSSSPTNHMYLNPHELSVQLNPNAVLDHSMAHKEPNSQSLCLSLSSYPLELNLQRYASLLKGSKFLKPAQVLLEEICDGVKGIYSEKDSAVDLSDSCQLMENLSGNYGGEQTGKKSRLISMLDEVYMRYKQYYQQMQTVIASFESVPGLTSAAALANMALRALSKHFRCLKNAISDQLQFTVKSKRETAYNKLENSGIAGAYGQRPLMGYKDNQPVWRPQRGLPERAVTVLRAWLFEHFLHPYPTDTDKLMLAGQTGLSRNQVSNWFINARVRLWKPMVEEMHMLETHSGPKNSLIEQQNDHLPTRSSFEEFSLKRDREDITETPLPYDNLLHDPHLSTVGLSNAGSVSLTLGLHQNGVGLSESYPITTARRFGLETDQNGQFGRDIIGGQLPHDFVWRT